MTRVRRISAAVAILTAALLQPSYATHDGERPQSTAVRDTSTLVYVGTYTGRESKGIYLFNLDEKDPAQISLSTQGLAAETPSPSFFAIDPIRNLLVAVNEVDDFEGRPTGSISAFSIDRATGKLTLLNQRPSMGKGPCHIVFDKTRRHVLVANYGSGTVAVLPVGGDGRLGEATAVVQHTGSSINKERQEGPHAHCMALDPANRFAFACDLGLDKILSYRFDDQSGTLTPNKRPFATVKPGAGPRHMVFRPDARFAYVANELHSTVTAFRYDHEAGVLSELQSLSTLPKDFKEQNSVAEIVIHPGGEYLYVSNRGHNSVALFAIDDPTGRLRYVETLESGGQTPRHFAIAPSGTHLLIGNQGSNTIQVVPIDRATGRRKGAGTAVDVPSPVMIGFFRRSPV